jgi:hypothetical protein
MISEALRIYGESSCRSFSRPIRAVSWLTRRPRQDLPQFLVPRRIRRPDGGSGRDDCDRERLQAQAYQAWKQASRPRYRRWMR